MGQDTEVNLKLEIQTCIHVMCTTTNHPKRIATNTLEKYISIIRDNIHKISVTRKDGMFAIVSVFLAFYSFFLRFLSQNIDSNLSSDPINSSYQISIAQFECQSRLLSLGIANLKVILTAFLTYTD